MGGNNYWVRLVLRESAELGVFLYMGWIFRSRKTDMSLAHFPIPTNEPCASFPLPPIHKVVSPSPVLDGWVQAGPIHSAFYV